MIKETSFEHDYLFQTLNDSNYFFLSINTENISFEF
jgi:hypothetical protein